MSRSGYIDDMDSWPLIQYRGQVASVIRGKRGQTFLLDLLKALDVLPKKELIAHELVAETGEVCALGALGVARGLDMKGIDPEDTDKVASTFGIADQLAREIVYLNDEWGTYLHETPEQRFNRMRAWIVSKILPIPLEGTAE